MKALAIRKKSTGEIELSDYFYKIFPDNHKHMLMVMNLEHYETIEVEITPTNAQPSEPKGEIGNQQTECIECGGKLIEGTLLILTHGGLVHRKCYT